MYFKGIIKGWMEVVIAGSVCCPYSYVTVITAAEVFLFELFTSVGGQSRTGA